MSDANQSDNELSGKVALVTGAGRGIGKSVALELARNGADILCVSRTEANAKEAAEAVRQLGRNSWAFAVDVADAEGVRALVKQALEVAGKIDILVNNAGITRDNLLMRMSDEEWDQVLDTNLKSAFVMIQALTRSFLKQRSGRIINISSIIGLTGNAGQANYAASKAGLIGLTKSVAKEFASRGITANAIAPGFIETDMTHSLKEEIRDEILKKIPLNTFGNPEDIARAVCYLAGPGGRFITGQVLVLDGGMTI